MRLLMLALLSALPFAVLHADSDGDLSAIETCLHSWGKHPFAGKAGDYRTISSKVRVFGVGDSIDDTKVTDKPELVLVKPNVTVMSKTEMQLMNPNGWYCLKSNVAVLGKSVVKLNCKANLASSSDGATVLGSSDQQGSVAVLGSARVERVNCAHQ